MKSRIVVDDSHSSDEEAPKAKPIADSKPDKKHRLSGEQLLVDQIMAVVYPDYDRSGKGS